MKILIKIFLLALVFVPFLNDRSVFFSDSTGKIFFVRLIVVITSIFFLLSFIFLKNFRDEIIQKITIFFRHPLFISVLTFVFVFIVSTIFAVDKYSAFWGDVQRGEGLVGIIFFLAIFIFSLLIFEKKDWYCFFKLNLFATLFLLGKEFFDFFSEAGRPGSFIGNPTFLAGYLLFSIFFSILVFYEANNKFWKYFSIGILIFSFLGIFITETRGAILGLVLGSIVIFIYGAFKGKTITYKKISFKKVSVIVLCLLIILFTVFFATKKGEFWQKIPGFARVATINSEDISTRTRLFSIKSSLASVNPTENGLKKFIIGYGPDNFILAFGKYYISEQYRYEIEWFDRAHNKLLDVLVMNGILGLFAYLAIWIFYFREILRKKNFSLKTIGFIFLGTSFFVHLLFVFDHISTSASFFIVVAFLVSFSFCADDRKEFKKTLRPQKYKKLYIGSIFVVLTLFICFSFFRGDVPAYMQMKKYLAFKNINENKIVISKIDSVFEPFTIAQTVIRREFLVTFFKNRDIADKKTNELFNKALVQAEDYINKMPFDFRFIGSIAGVYVTKGKEINNTEFIKIGEGYFRKALSFIPNRPDYNYGLALSLAYQNKYYESFQVLEKVIEVDKNLADSYFYYGFILSLQGDKNYKEALDFFEKSFDIKSDLFLKNKKEAENVYSNFVKYFYNKKDKDYFIKTIKRLIENNNTQSVMLNQMLKYVEERGIWPLIEFK